MIETDQIAETNDRPWEGWVILELMGHRRLAGRLCEQQIGGATFLRLDVPGDDEMVATQFYAPSAVYCITPTSQGTVRRVARLAQVAPVQPWELPALTRGSDDEGPF